MKIALCDNRSMFGDSLAGALHSRGHEVVGMHGDRDEVAELVALSQPQVCVLDVDVPHVVTVATAHAIHQVRADVPLVFLTALDVSPVWDAYDRRVVDGVVNKSCDLDRLDASLHRVRSGERLVEGWSRAADRHPRPDPTVGSLTGREMQVLQLIVGGASTETMTVTLGVSTNTVRTHVQSLMQKLGVHGRTRAIRFAIEHEMVEMVPADRYGQ